MHRLQRSAFSPSARQCLAPAPSRCHPAMIARRSFRPGSRSGPSEGRRRDANRLRPVRRETRARTDVRRLAAGGDWIRTIGIRKISYRFETDFCHLRDGSGSRRGFVSFATGNRWFESSPLQRGIRCELDLGEGGSADEIAAAIPIPARLWFDHSEGGQSSRGERTCPPASKAPRRMVLLTLRAARHRRNERQGGVASVRAASSSMRRWSVRIAAAFRVNGRSFPARMKRLKGRRRTARSSILGHRD